MKLPIIPGEVLITEDQLTGLPEEQPILPKIIKFGAATLAYTLAVTAYNGIIYLDKFKFQGYRDDIEMIEDAEKCEPFDYVEEDEETGEVKPPQGFTLRQAANTIAVESDYEDTDSAAYNTSPGGWDIGKTKDQVLEINSHEFDSFNSVYSGLDIHLYSDSGEPFAMIDNEIIDELVHSSLDEQIDFDHITVNQFMECARNQILLSNGGSLLAGERLNLYISSRPGVCISNGQIQEFPDIEGVKFEDFCDSSGFTIKDLEFKFIPGLLNYRQSWMAVTTNRRGEAAVQRTSRNLIHEPIHLWQQTLELPFKYNPNERLADYIDKSTRETLYPNGMPAAVQFRPSN